MSAAIVALAWVAGVLAYLSIGALLYWFSIGLPGELSPPDEAFGFYVTLWPLVIVISGGFWAVMITSRAADALEKALREDREAKP